MGGKKAHNNLFIILSLLRIGLDWKFALRTGCDRMSEFSGYDKNGRFVMIMRQKFADPDHFSVHTIYKTLLMLFTIAMEGNRQAYCRGYVILSDQEQSCNEGLQRFLRNAL